MNLKKLSVMALVACLSLTGCQMFGGHSPYTNKAHIDSDVDKALGKLYATNPEAKKLAKNAKGILVFPSVVKAGFIGGASRLGWVPCVSMDVPWVITISLRVLMVCRRGRNLSITSCSL